MLSAIHFTDPFTRGWKMLAESAAAARLNQAP